MLPQPRHPSKTWSSLTFSMCRRHSVRAFPKACVHLHAVSWHPTRHASLPRLTLCIVPGVISEATPSKVRARRWEAETETVTMRIYETETSTVMSIPTWCLNTPTATHPAPTTWPGMTTPAPPPHTELPPPVWTIPTPPPHFELPPPVWHTPAPSPPQSPVVSKPTTSVVTITSEACTTCTPHIWTSTVSLPLSPVPTPSSSHYTWSSPPSTPSSWSSTTPSYPSTSAPVHSSTTTPAAYSPSTTVSYSHTTHTYGTMKPIYTHPTSITPPVLGGVGKVEGSVLAMLAFVAAAVVIPAL